MRITRFISHFVLFFTLCILMMSSFSACNTGSDNLQSDELNGTITISGAWALYPIMTCWAEEFTKTNPYVQFDISAGGAGKGMSDAIANAVDIGMVSRAITPEEEAKGAYWISVTKDAVFPVMNIENPVYTEILKSGIKREFFVKIFITGDTKTWGEIVGISEIKDEIHIYTRSDAAGAPETWAKYLGKNQEDLLGIGVFGDPGLVEAVVKDPLGIGYNNLGYSYDADSGKPINGVMIIPIDANENGFADPDEILETKVEAINAVALGLYPSPPARELNLVTHEKPKGLIKSFLEWILRDGQAFVGEAGYVQLTQAQLDEALSKLR